MTKADSEIPVDHPDAHFLAPAFVQRWTKQVLVDCGPFLCLHHVIHVWGRGPASRGQLVDRDRHGTCLSKSALHPKGGVFLVLCGLLYSRGQGETDSLCIPAGGGLREQVLLESGVP